MTKQPRVICLAAALAMAPGLALAEGEWTVGLGAGTGTNVYEGQKDETAAIPFLSYDTERFHIGMDGLSYKILTDEAFDVTLSLAPGEAPDFKDYAKHDKRFAGLTRETPIEFGAGVEYRMEMLHVGLSVAHDIASASGGYHAEAMAGVAFPLGKGVVDVGVGARVRDKKLNNHLYGVTAKEANALRPAYDVGATVQPFLTGQVAYPITERVSVMGFFEYEKLDEKVTKSPLVKDDAAYSVGLGVVYKF